MRRPTLQGGLHSRLIRPCHDKVDVGNISCTRGKHLQHEVAAFLLVDTAEEQEKAPSANLGKPAVEYLHLAGRIARFRLGVTNAVWNDDAVPGIGPELVRARSRSVSMVKKIALA